MNKYVIGGLVAVAAIALGVGAAYSISRLAVSTTTSVNTPLVFNSPNNNIQTLPYNNQRGGGMMNNRGWGNNPNTNPNNVPNNDQNYNNFGYEGPMGRGGMMGNLGNNNIPANATRITMDQAVTAVQTAIAKLGSNFVVKSVMEYQNNFYAAVLEKDTGRGAFEVLVNPYTGRVSYEPGPDMMWNLKYGHMRGGMMGGILTNGTGDNIVTMEQAITAAQKALDAQVASAKLETDGVSFYGYYTFDYTVNGTVAGMLSVNGTDSSVWLHTWHGAFITEQAVTK